MKSLGSGMTLAIGVGAVVLVGLWLRSSGAEADVPGGAPPYFLPVTLATVEHRDLAPVARMTGTVSAPRHARLGFDVAGRIRSLEVREGEVVEKGAELARLWDLDQQASLRRAQAAAELAARQLASEQAGARPEEVRRLEAELGARIAEAELAENEVERNRELAGSAVISSSRFDTLVSASDAASARVEAARERLAEAKAGSRVEDIEVARAELGLRQAEVGIAQREVDKTLLVAPFAGSVVARLGAEGDTFAAGRPLIELVDLDDREIVLEIPSGIVPRLGEAPALRVTLDGQPDFVVAARLDTLVVVADEQSRNFRGLVRLEPAQDPGLLLKPGVFVRVELDLEPLRGNAVVPSDAVRVTLEGSIVVKAVPQEPEGGGPPQLLAELVPVRVLGSEGGASAVVSLAGPLAAGDQVVVTGVDLAFPGAPLMPAGAGGPAGEAGPGPADDPGHADAGEVDGSAVADGAAREREQ